MDFFQITTIKVLDILQILKLGKASGLDSIIHQMPLKKTRVILSVFLSLLFNISLSKSIGNVFERIVFKEVFNHLISNNLLYAFQSGFVPGHSTVHQLIEIYYRIYISLDDYCFTTPILCDISKAFDRVWHTGLLLKLKAYGADGKIFKWFESYISSRKHCVFVSNSLSPLVNTHVGVPQGLVLEPLLFLLYVNDIEDNLLCLTRMFADDTSLSYSSQSPYTIEDVMNSDLESISIWSKQWLVNFNPLKIKTMVFSNINLPSDVEITFHDKLVEFVTCHKHF